MTCNQTIERFFAGPWSDAIRYCRGVIFLVFFGWFGFALWQTTKVSPLTEEEAFVPDDHPSQLGYAMIRDSFTTGADEKPSVIFFWGGTSIDKSQVHKFNSSYAGEIELDQHFNMATADS